MIYDGGICLIKKISIVLVIALFLLGGISWYLYQDPFYMVKPGIKVDAIDFRSDKDGDGKNDLVDIVEGARKEIANKSTYRSAYYEGGYPPENEGVCTDVVWRALRNTGYDLKSLMDEDIKNNTDDYPTVKGSPDPNIDFRRVKNQYIFFNKYALNLTLEVKPFNSENLEEWQPGDIVALKDGDHVAVISDRRRKDGVPYIIHNSNSVPKEQDLLGRWYRQGRIIGHYRFPKIN